MASFLDLLEEEEEEKTKVEVKPKRERKPRQRKSSIDTTKILGELNEIKQAIATLQTQINTNTALDTKTIQGIARTIADAVITQIQDYLTKTISNVIAQIAPKVEIDSNAIIKSIGESLAKTQTIINLDALAEKIVEKIIMQDYVIRRIAEKTMRIPKPKIPRKIFLKDLRKKLQTIPSLQEKIIYILFYRFAGAQSSELAKILLLDKQTIHETLIKLRQNGLLAKRRPHNRYILNMQNKTTIETLKKYFDEEIIRVRQLEFAELLKKNLIIL